jgi:hypothetical protein
MQSRVLPPEGLHLNGEPIMTYRIAPFAGLLGLCLALAGCNSSDEPAGHAKLDTGAAQTGNSAGPAGGGQAAVGTTPSGAISTTPTR